MRLPDLEAWAIFATVAAHGSITAAAAELALSKATVSKALARLEGSLGQALFHRTSRRLTLTEAGLPLADRAKRILAEAQCAEEAARDAATTLAGRIRVAAPLSFGVASVAPLVAEFLVAHPQVEIDLRLSDARANLIGDGYDVALRIADLPDSSLRARRLCDIASHLVAAPSYLAAHGTPRHPADLATHRLLGYANVAPTWRLRHRTTGEEASVVATGPLVSDSGDALLPALAAGLGIARLPAFIVGELLAAGAIVTLLEAWTPPPIGLHLLTPPSPLRPARVEALIAFLAERLHRRD